MAFDANAYQREYQARKRAGGREMPPPPECTNKRLRRACDRSLYKFGIELFPEVFYLEPSPDHKRLAEQIQAAIENGTKRAIAVQRGFGKTAWCATAVNWATLTGRVDMAMLISGNQDEADVLRDGIVTVLESSERLAEIYPEIPHFFAATSLHGPQLKATYQGKQLKLERRPDVVFPVVPFVGSEACIRVRGIDSKGIRGAHHVRTDGKRVRPALVLLDDPQDDDLARSSTEVKKRVAKIKKTIHGLAPPGKSLSVLMPCTPIEKGDLAEAFLDMSKTPEYQGIRWPAMDAWPDCFNATEGNLWTQYFEILAEDQASGLDSFPNATSFYVSHKTAMSKGAAVRWEARIENHCVDALQSLMNKYAEGRAAFMSEMMMEPEDTEGTTLYLDDDDLARRFNRLNRGQVPPDAKTCTVSIDVQKRLLYWLAIHWTEDRKGFVTDYGTYPKQPRPQFTHLDAPNTMMRHVQRQFGSGLTWEESLKFCIRRLVDTLASDLAPGVILIDNRWNECRTPVNEVAGEAEYSDILQPAGGLFVGGGEQRISARKMGKGSKRPSTDVEWYFKRDPEQPPALLFDANHYRSALQQGLATEPGQAGSVTFFGRIANQTLADHFGAKQMALKEGTKRTIEEWKNKPGRNQDHWLDCAVMNRVALELLGYRPTATGSRSGGTVTSSRKITAADVERARAR